MTVYTIPPTSSFVDALARGLLARAEGDPMKLAAMTVLLPNRRACRNLREAFLRQSGGTPLLLPAIRPIGDVDEDALILGPESLDAAMPVPVHPLRRTLVLAQYLNRMDSERHPMAQALPLAAELGRLVDSIHTEGLDFQDFERLFPEQYAAHWADVVNFLKNILGVFWPRQLKRENALDPGAYRHAMITAYAQHLRANPPAGPVFAAGSTGSIPVTADLIKVVAGLPEGHVVLPGLDTLLDDASWNDDLLEGHPQAGLQRLLTHLDVDRVDVEDWEAHAPAPREHLISAVMRPAPSLDRWKTERLPDGAFDGLSLLEADTIDDEAAAIAAIMRNHAQDTAADEPCVLVTPDRILAGRVARCLARWNIAIDDSAGQPLARTPAGTWFLLLCELLHDDLAPVTLLAALKHPLAAGGAAWPRTAPPFRNFVRALDRLLRGPRPAPGFAGLYHALSQSPGKADGLRAGVEALEKMFNPLAIAADTPARLRALVRLAEDLAATPEHSGAQRLWAGDAGEAAATAVAALLEQADVLPPLDWAGVRAVLEAAMDGISVRPRFGTHPRLAILGPIEARLYQAPTMILAGLNEGVWPRMAEVDAWMSRPMRRDFGLPAPERAITLSAHDFCQGLGARRVILTRSKIRDGAPAVPSRWLQRLDAVCAANGFEGLHAEGDRWIAVARALDTPQGPARPAARPRVNPPVDARPKSLRVTEIARLRADPYGIYARHVLGLTPLDPLDAQPDARGRGTLIHAALEEYLRAFPDRLPADARDQLIAIGTRVFAQAQAHPDVSGHWWPRFLRLAGALAAFEPGWRENVLHAWPEKAGTITFGTAAGPFTLRGRADRIEQRRDGWAVIDYKTGAAPGKGAVEAGDEPQLSLLGAMLVEGAFNDALGLGDANTPDTVSTLSYWPVGGNKDVFEPADINRTDLDALCRDARAGLEKLVRAYLDDGIPYVCWPDPDRKLREDDEYAHLARISEWSSGEETEDAA